MPPSWRALQICAHHLSLTPSPRCNGRIFRCPAGRTESLTPPHSPHGSVSCKSWGQIALSPGDLCRVGSGKKPSRARTDSFIALSILRYWRRAPDKRHRALPPLLVYGYPHKHTRVAGANQLTVGVRVGCFAYTAGWGWTAGRRCAFPLRRSPGRAPDVDAPRKNAPILTKWWKVKQQKQHNNKPKNDVCCGAKSHPGSGGVVVRFTMLLNVDWWGFWPLRVPKPLHPPAFCCSCALSQTTASPQGGTVGSGGDESPKMDISDFLILSKAI